MIDYSEKEGALCFKVQVVPRASLSEITGVHGSALRIRLAAPPVDGAANEELIRVLAKAFGVRKSAVTIAAGHTSKHKEVRIQGASVDELRQIANRSEQT